MLNERRVTQSASGLKRRCSEVSLWRLASQVRIGTPVLTKSEEVVRKKKDSLPLISRNQLRTFSFDLTYLDDDIKERSHRENQASSIHQNVYLGACTLFDVKPFSLVTDALATKTLSLTRMNLGPRDLKAFCVALVDNPYVKHLNLSENSLGPVGTRQLCQALSENNFVSHLVISGCKIGKGVRWLAALMKDNTTIKHLNISDNGIEEGHAIYIARILELSVSLVDFNMAGNRICTRGAEVIAEILGGVRLEKLNLSWNHIRLQGGVAICRALQDNSKLKSLDLSWNGLHLEGSRALCQMLAGNTCLQELNISCNRIDRTCLHQIIPGLSTNQTLATLKIGHNPVTNEGALMLLRMLRFSPKSNLRTLDFSNLAVDGTFLQMLRTVRISRDLNCVYGHVISDVNLVSYDEMKALVDEEPMLVLMEFMRLQNLRLIDLFSALDTDGSKGLSMEEFKAGLQKSNIPLSEKQLSRLVRKLDSDGNGEIDMAELMAGQKEHRRKMTMIREESRDLPYEQTPVGRLSAKLQDLISSKHLRKKPGPQITADNPDITPYQRRASLHQWYSKRQYQEGL